MSANRSNRREFLTGQAAVDALAGLDVGTVDGAVSRPPSESYLVRWSRRAMACTFEVFLNAGQHECGSEAALAALDLVEQLEDQLSIFRPHSEISRLNRAAAGEAVKVEPQLFELLARAVEIHRHTQGAFDVTCGQLSGVWGFTRRRGKIPSAEEIEAARTSMGSEYLELDSAACSVRFRRPGLQINLGSIGKGYALDRAAASIVSAGVGDFLLHGGSSSVLARGTHGAPAGERGWPVGVRNPLHPDRRLGMIRLSDRALATSGSGTQFFMHARRRYGHILDPRTGWPAEGVLSASVLAPSAAVADALATAFYVMGPGAAGDYCKAHPDVAAVMVCPGEREGSLRTHVVGLAEQDWTALNEA